ncbi:PTS transporter subunit EIIC [Enterococcus hirae]|jgi:PTS system N-acetylglucosamine-specific IIC component|nr:PTS transporter subunit EIIC [Enterococcaceae bacterium]MDM8214067.1 PTS transporter subunit EIIC [Enterococcus hirae]
MRKIMKKVSDGLQLLGRSMLLAISVMPAAAILNRISDQDLLNIPFLKTAAWTIFAILPILFAVSVAGGIAKDKNVAAGLSAVIVYEILVRTLQKGDTGLNSFGRVAVANVENNILIGIIAGIVAGLSYEKFKDKQLPAALSFFSGRRLVAIMASFFAIIVSWVLAYAFPPLDSMINHLGVAIGNASAGPFFFGVLNRLLIPTGLHHIINTYIQMQLPSSLPQFAGVVGEIPRYFAGDPTAGRFVAGFFPMMMFGLPGAALAMYHCARPENKEKVKGLLFGAALTSFITGITEPIEFSFMFVSPLLFLTHAVLLGLSNVVCNIFGAKIVGVGGSGIIDYVLQFNRATRPFMILAIGLALGAVYYFTFTFMIKKFDLKTPGREPATATAAAAKLSITEKAKKILPLLGGAANLISIDNCITRLRLEVKDPDKIDVAGLKNLGIIEVMKMANKKVHVVVGLEVEQLAPQIKQLVEEVAPKQEQPS